jgi:ubiquinone/menaquinone biosynthesis C-methylase UbiE
MKMDDARAQEDQTRLTLLWMCTGYRNSMVFLTSLELDVYSAIPEEGATADDVAKRIAADATGMRVLMNVLVTLGVLEKAGTRYRIVPECAPYLRRGPSYIGGALLAHKAEYEYWLNAPAILRGCYRGPRFADHKYEGELAAPTLDVVTWNNRSYARLLWETLAGRAPGLRRVLDVGAGRGYFSEALLEANDKVEITIVDAFQGSLDGCREYLSGSRGFDRVSFVRADALALAYDGEFDLVMGNDLLHYFDRAQKMRFLQRAHRALRPGGTCLEVGFHLDDDGCQPSGSASFSLWMFVHTAKAYLATDRETVELFREAGFSNVESRPLEDKRLVTGTR